MIVSLVFFMIAKTMARKDAMTSSNQSPECDKGQAVHPQPDCPANPSRRNMLMKMGAGIAGTALAYYGLSRYGGASRTIASRAPLQSGTLTYRVNPKNGDKISLLGYGCMRFPVLSTATSPGSPEIDEPAATALIDHAIEYGVNFFDTAWMYHRGMSQVIMGNALKRHPRSEHFICNKMPTPMRPTLEVAKETFATQLERCQTDYFDYYLLHAIRTTQEYKDIYEDGGVLDYLLSEKAAGRIRNLGFSFHGDQESLEYLLSRDVDWDIALVQLNYHDLMGEYKPPGWLTANVSGIIAEPRWILEKMLPTNIPLMIMEPLLGGRLARLNRMAVNVLQNEIPDASAASWAFRYVGAIPNVVTVLSGMTYMEHLQDNLHTYSPYQPLNDREMAALQRALDYFLNPDIIPCTACSYCMPCKYGVDIPAIFTHYNHCLDDKTIPKGVRNADYARARRAFLVGYDRAVPELRQAERCTSCNICTPECPQNIDIPAELALIGKFAEQLRNEV